MALNLVPDGLIIKDQSEIYSDTPRWTPKISSSSAVSSDIESMQKRMKELERELLSCQTYNKLVASPMVIGFFQMHLNLTEFEKIWRQESSIKGKERVQLENKLLTAFDAEPLEDGMDHPAEQIIGQVLDSRENETILRLLRAFSLDVSCPSFAASVLRCLARLPHTGTLEWRTSLVRDALSTNDIEIRDAAVHAAELWGDQEMCNILGQHVEPKPWLRDYISDVLVDLSD